MKRKAPCVRMCISVQDELYNKMCTYTDNNPQVNWSAVAQAAFGEFMEKKNA